MSFHYSIITVVFNNFVSFWKHKKYDLFKKNILMEKVNILQHGTKEMYGGYTFQVTYEFLIRVYIQIVAVKIAHVIWLFTTYSSVTTP